LLLMSTGGYRPAHNRPVCYSRNNGKELLTALAIAMMSAAACADPIAPGAIQVVDGDTIRVAGETFRLVGFDAPETYRAQCASEQEVGNRATFRLRQLIAGGGLDLEPIECSCQVGTQGTPVCNYGRSCGVLRVRGKDVAQIMIGEGLAHPLVCGPTRCPKRAGWC
jgi:endonuclease YncB( thermonuclease family)